MKYKKGDRVRVVGYNPEESAYATIVGKTGTVEIESVYVCVRLDDMPPWLDHVWLFNYDELELVE